MRMKVQVKFTEEERLAVLEAATLVGVSVDVFCKKAVHYCINDMYRRAAELEAQRDRNNTETGNIKGDIGAARDGTGTDSTALSDQTDASIGAQV